MKLNHLRALYSSLATVMFVVVVLCNLTVTAQVKVVAWNESAPDKNLVWHPEAIYIVWPEMKLDFMLPEEKDRSGVANLLFRNRKSGEILLLDSVGISPRYKSKMWIDRAVTNIKDARYYTHFEPGSYDAILLYNNGKHICYYDITFDKGIHKVIDLVKQPTQLANVESRNWLTLRKFNTIIGRRTLNKDNTPASENKILGYVFYQKDGEVSSMATIASFQENDNDKSKITKCLYDGYFELDMDDDSDLTLEISDLGSKTKRIHISSNSGFFIVLETNPILEEELRDIKTGPMKKIKK